MKILEMGDDKKRKGAGSQWDGYEECDKQRSQCAGDKILTSLKSVEKHSLNSVDSGFPSSCSTIMKCFVATIAWV